MAEALQHGQAALSAGISTTGATDDEPVPDTARSGRANAIVSQSRWYKKSVRSNPWRASFIRSVDGGVDCAAINWHRQPLWMLLIFRCTRARAGGVFLAHVGAVLEISVVLMSGEMINFRI
jgi:hypothetical protein